MTVWDGLVADALLGTERRPVALPRPTGPLGDTLARLEQADAEGALLGAAATVALWRRAGRRAETDPAPPPEPCPPDDSARVGAAAGERLAGLLEGERRQVLPEWLDLVAAAGRRAPEEHLPALLDLGSHRPDLRMRVVAVAGRRGPWLGAQNPAWAWAAGVDDADRTWATGLPDARRLLLATLRATDPSRARDLLSSTWSTEAPEDRAAFVSLLADNLSAADEPFLESALDDRRKEVRRAAADLLARLPTSRLAGRMAERARSMVRAEGRRRRRLTLTLPAALDPAAVDPAAVRDGVDRSPGGRRGRWLEQVVAATPLDVWAGALGADLPQVLDLALGDDHGAELVSGWATAAVRQCDRRWAAALLERVDRADLVAALDREEAEAVVARRMADVGLAAPASLAMLRHVPPPWSPALSRQVVAALAREAVRPASQPGAHPLRQSLPELAVRLHPSVTPDAEAGLAQVDNWWSRSVGELLDLLTFRREMAEEIAAP